MEKIWFAAKIKMFKRKKCFRATFDSCYSNVKPKDEEHETADYYFKKRWFETHEEALAFSRSQYEH